MIRNPLARCPLKMLVLFLAVSPLLGNGTVCLGAGAAKSSQHGQHSQACTCDASSGERIVYVPMTVIERRRVPVTKYRTEIEEKTTAVRKSVPETKQVRDIYVEMVSHVETRKEKYLVHIPEWHTVMQKVTVEVPTQELRKTTRSVCRRVQVEELQCITRDNGHWEEDSENPCCKVWKPEIETIQVPVVVCRDEIVEEPIEYYATVYHPETRLVPVKICKPIVEEREREVQVTVCEPRKREAIRNVSTFRSVIVPETIRCPVRIPYTDYEEVEEPVCRQVAKRICCDCGGEIAKP